MVPDSYLFGGERVGRSITVRAADNVLLSAIPFTPGGLGVVEAGIVGLLQLQLTVESAIATALVNRTVSLITASVGGVVFAVRQVRIMRNSMDTG